MTDNIYARSTGPLRLTPSFVCFADILGYKERSQEAIRTGQGMEFLNRLRDALSRAHERLREHSEPIGLTPFYSIKIFTDNIVVGYPLHPGYSNYGEPELGDILLTFAELQATLAADGFFIRGGIAYGDHYMDEDIVFGEALLQVVKLNQSGGLPRLVLAPSAVEIIREHLGFYAFIEDAPHYWHLFQDADGAVFVNYLSEAFCGFPDGISFDLIEAHQRAVIRGLQDYRAKPDIRAKFEWADRYHNFVCHEFVRNHPVPTHPDVDEGYALATQEAQRVLDFIIDVESLAATPSTLSITPTWKRLGQG